MLDLVLLPDLLPQALEQALMLLAALHLQVLLLHLAGVKAQVQKAALVANQALHAEALEQAPLCWQQELPPPLLLQALSCWGLGARELAVALRLALVLALTLAVALGRHALAEEGLLQAHDLACPSLPASMHELGRTGTLHIRECSLRLAAHLVCSWLRSGLWSLQQRLQPQKLLLRGCLRRAGRRAAELLGAQRRQLCLGCCHARGVQRQHLCLDERQVACVLPRHHNEPGGWLAPAGSMCCKRTTLSPTPSSRRTAAWLRLLWLGWLAVWVQGKPLTTSCSMHTSAQSPTVTQPPGCCGSGLAC